MRTKHLFLIFTLCFPLCLASQNRTDSIDVLHYNINLSIKDFSTKIITGHTSLTIQSKADSLSTLLLDFCINGIDSIKVNQVPVSNYSFNQQECLLNIALPFSIMAEDSFEVVVFYTGVPPILSNFGGFYFSGDYAYNMGVSIYSTPHPCGRAWFPCCDSFTDKATFDFCIKTKTNHKAICNGSFIDSLTIDSTTKQWRWSLFDPIPTYLASVAVGNYQLYADSVTSISGRVIPIYIYTKPTLHNAVSNSFGKLKQSISLFEQAFGAFPRERIGYVGVDFTGGAMEHSTNIAYPNYAISGNEQEERLYIHELSHEWFGNLITCEQAKEMWLNEGFASYLELFALEAFYGQEHYLQTYRQEHRKVLKGSNTDALSEMPDENTYGFNTYKKGAMAVHDIRHLMGDSLFLLAMKTLINTFKFANISTNDFFSHIGNFLNLDMSSYCQAYFRQGGFLHFSIDSVQAKGGQKYDVYYKQRLLNAINYGENIPVDISFFDLTGQRFDAEKCLLSGQSGAIELTLPFVPYFWIVDLNEKMSDPIIDTLIFAQKDSTIKFSDGACQINFDNESNPDWLHVQHHLVNPEIAPLNGIWTTSQNHYWTINYVDSSAFDTKIKFQYSKTASGYDKDLLESGFTGKIALLYRRNASAQWQWIPCTTTGNALVGYLEPDCLRAGDYALAFAKMDISVDDIAKKAPKIYPNPVTDNLFIELEQEDFITLELIDAAGKVIEKTKIKSGQIVLNLRNYPSGSYYLRLRKTSDKSCLTFGVIKK